VLSTLNERPKCEAAGDIYNAMEPTVHEQLLICIRSLTSQEYSTVFRTLALPCRLSNSMGYVKPMSVTLNSIKKLGNRTTKLGTTFQRLCNNKISMLRPSNSFWRVTSSSFYEIKLNIFVVVLLQGGAFLAHHCVSILKIIYIILHLVRDTVKIFLHNKMIVPVIIDNTNMVSPSKTDFKN
jgi:hypothetical protein